MPQLTVEYTQNLKFDIQSLLERLHSTLASTGAIRMRGLKSRAIALADYRIADGNPEYAFVHVTLFIQEGRSIDVQQVFAERMMAILKEQFGHYLVQGFISLSVDIQEMRKDIAITLHNIPD